LRCIAGDFDLAAADMNRALELYRELGNLSGQADTFSNLGSLQRQTGDYAAAAAKPADEPPSVRTTGVVFRRL
jgi:hypothetical protein